MNSPDQSNKTRGAQPLPERGSEVDGRYEVVRAIGDGGFGWVFEVKHKLLGQRFAMKILHPTIARDKDWIIRFREEAKATGLARHESIVFVTDFGSCPKYGYYFVMEFLNGETLADHIQKTPRSDLSTVRDLMLTAAGGIGAVHELDIVHCDLKPGNIMLVERRGKSPAFKFLDFGTSTLVFEAAKSDLLFGTPAYMAPEQAVGLAVDARADQFSLGCIVYEMLTGELPWPVNEWKDAFPEPRMRYIPPDIHFLRGDITPRMNEVVMRAIEVFRDSRWPDVESFAEALVDAIDEVLPRQDATSFVPTLDPLDVVRSDSNFRRSLTAPRVQVPDDLASMIIELPEDSEIDINEVDMRLEINIVYRTADRLRREWRRNFIAGGMFLAADTRPAIDTQVRVNLTFLPAKTSIEFDAIVVSHRDNTAGESLGFGIRFDEDNGRRLRRFVRRLEVGIDMKHGDILRRVDDDLIPDSLSAGEVFLWSRLESPIAVGRARAMCSGLPFDFDEVVTRLLDQRLLVIDHTDEDSVVWEVSEVIEVTEVHVDPPRLSTDQAHQVNETVAQFIAQQNYMAAMHVLQNAVQLAPNRADFHGQIAEIAFRFAGDSTTAKSAIERAVELDPRDSELLALAQEIYR